MNKISLPISLNSGMGLGAGAVFFLSDVPSLLLDKAKSLTNFTREVRRV